MEANPPIYPLIIADYKEHLRDASIPHLSFHFFCRHYKVKIKSVRQWMHRHGLDVTTMRYDALFEECNHSPETALAQSSASMVFLCRTRRCLQAPMFFNRKIILQGIYLGGFSRSYETGPFLL